MFILLLEDHYIHNKLNTSNALNWVIFMLTCDLFNTSIWIQQSSNSLGMLPQPKALPSFIPRTLIAIICFPWPFRLQSPRPKQLYLAVISSTSPNSSVPTKHAVVTHNSVFSAYWFTLFEAVSRRRTNTQTWIKIPGLPSWSSNSTLWAISRASLNLRFFNCVTGIIKQSCRELLRGLNKTTNMKHTENWGHLTYSDRQQQQRHFHAVASSDTQVGWAGLAPSSWRPSPAELSLAWHSSVYRSLRGFEMQLVPQAPLHHPRKAFLAWLSALRPSGPLTYVFMPSLNRKMLSPWKPSQLCLYSGNLNIYF